jgi:hypothetical protein
VRELPDGTLFAADPVSQVFLRMDLESGSADTLGGVGEGPQEYQQPDQVFPLPGDSTLLVDLGNGRLIVVDPAGTFVQWIPMGQTLGGEGITTIHPRFVDAAGFIYHAGSRAGRDVPPDTTEIVRFDLEAGRETPVAWAWRPEYRRRSRDEPRPALRPVDDWAVGPDGSVAVARANSYSVDWYRSQGNVVEGPSYAYETFPLGEEEKEAELARMTSSAIFVSTVVDQGGEQGRSMSRGVPPGADMTSADFAWPETLPPFRYGGLLVSSTGEAWLTRMMPTGNPGRADVFDGEGLRLGYVELPPNRTLIGFGHRNGTRNLAYLVRTDEVGLKWLERYRILQT